MFKVTSSAESKDVAARMLHEASHIETFTVLGWISIMTIRRTFVRIAVDRGKSFGILRSQIHELGTAPTERSHSTNDD